MEDGGYGMSEEEETAPRHRLPPVSLAGAPSKWREEGGGKLGGKKVVYVR
jgi:hypothetical protein